MNRHQVLTGASNNDDSTAIGSVDNNYFTAYGSGSKLVILSSNFERIQVISSKLTSSYLRCVECTFETGKIAVAVDNFVFIYEPTPTNNKKHTVLNYKWIRIGCIKFESTPICICWNFDNNRLLIGLQSGALQMWSYNSNLTAGPKSRIPKLGEFRSSTGGEPVKFSIEEEDNDELNAENEDKFSEGDATETDEDLSKDPKVLLKKIWEKHLPSPVKYLKYSPDSTLFASLGENDRIVKIWQEVKSLSNLNMNSNGGDLDGKEIIDYDSIYLAHPRAVTGMQWRKISNYLPKGCITNSLLTSCKDNVCRIWSETVLSEDGVISSKGESCYTSINNKAVRHKKNFMKKLHKISPDKESTHLSLSKHHHITHGKSESQESLPQLIHNSLSCNELFTNKNKYVTQPYHASRLHFHLAGFVEIDFGQFANSPNVEQARFYVHWMNNKELNFTIASEAFFNEVVEKLKKCKDTNRNKDTSRRSANGEYINDQDEDDINIEIEGAGGESQDTSRMLEQEMNHKLDKIIKDWYSSQDLLFCIHPLDGSILIWLVDWLDEYIPGNYRQPLVSFHAKLPNAISVGDAISLTNSVFLYSQQMQQFSAATQHYINEKRSATTRTSLESLTDKTQKHASYKKPDFHMFSGIINMVSKHNNGTLNLWRLQFQENSQYQSLINITHLSRSYGHRNRVSDISSHPILPFLLSNSIESEKFENLSNPNDECENFFTFCDKTQNVVEKNTEEKRPSPNVKGIIVWGVEPVGPLNITGGIYELARVDSTKENAFENIAWFPCFLPSFTLGNSSSSPSTLFVSSDSTCITIYQAVFDARTLLHDLKYQKNSQQNSNTFFSLPNTVPTAQPKPKWEHTYSSNISSASNITDIAYDSFNVISIQSTARPGCIIELDKLADSNEYWLKADLCHIYQEELIYSPSKPKHPTHTHHQNSKSNQHFNEAYFLVILEKNKHADSSLTSIVHMWKIIVTSTPTNTSETRSNSSSSNFNNGMLNSVSFDSQANTGQPKNRLSITSTKVCREELKLPPGVMVVSADSAAADLSSSSMFTLSQVPYLFSTACSDGIIRFWSCRNVFGSTGYSTDTSISSPDTPQANANERFSFSEWELNCTIDSNDKLRSFSASTSDKNTTHSGTFQDTHSKESMVNIENYPLALSCSYNGRFAVAYKHKDKSDSNFYVHIYECESTGGSAWKLEDVLCLENVTLPKLKIGINFDYIYGSQKPIKPSRSSNSFKNILINQYNHNAVQPQLTDNDNVMEIPSAAIRCSIKKKYLEKSHQTKDDQFQVSSSLVKLDWATTESGSHILMVCIANQVFVFSPVKEDSLNVNQEMSNNFPKSPSDSLAAFKPGHLASPETLTSPKKKNTIVNATSSYLQSIRPKSIVRWAQMRSFKLDSADDMQALPRQCKWVRDGLLVVSLSTEMQVFSQWSPINPIASKSICMAGNPNNNLQSVDTDGNRQILMIPKKHSILDLNKLNRLTNATGLQQRKPVAAEDTGEEVNSSSMNPRVYNENKILDMIQDSGIFVHAASQFPTLPQYHPKQLLELMNSGKVNRVKAILMHLTRCIVDTDLNQKSRSINSRKNLQRLQRKISLCSESEMPEQKVNTVLEIQAIPPLPLFALFAADDDTFSDEEDANGKHSSSVSSASDNIFKSVANKNLDDLDLDIDEFKFSIDDDYENAEAHKKKNLDNQKAKEKLAFKKNLLTDVYSTNKAVFFNSAVCKLLIEYLSYARLEGISSIDQIHLVAIADTVANIKCDVTFNSQNIFHRKKFISQQKSFDVMGDEQNEDENLTPTVDMCGFKFLLAMRSYNYLLRTLPDRDRDFLKFNGLGSAVNTWAFHSECQQELLDAIVHYHDAKPGGDSVEGNISLSLDWPTLRQYGVGFWLKSPVLLKTLIERIAKCAFQSNNDPLDAAIYYLALKKKAIVVALFKTVGDTKMMEFFRNDFTTTKWQTSACKNAFFLLGKQRFEHAAAFFLLAGRLKDAIEVCIRSLKDLQLAIVIVRLYETDIEHAQTIITAILATENLGYSMTNTESQRLYSTEHQSANVRDYLSAKSDKQKCCSDPFLRSISYWFINDYKQALNTLYDIDFVNIFDKTAQTEINKLDSSSGRQHFESSISQVFNFYTFLKNHPMVIRQNMIDENMQRRASITTASQLGITQPVVRGTFFRNNYRQQQITQPEEDTNLTLKTFKTSSELIISPIERRLHFTVAYSHMVNGCPLLTLDVLSKLPKYISSTDEQQSVTKPSPVMPKEDLFSQPIVSGSISSKEKADLFDWSVGGEMSKPVVDEEEFKIEFSDSSSESGSEDSNVFEKEEQADVTVVDVAEKGKQFEEEDEEGGSNKQVDMFAQQIKFLSCLKILIQEMSTLATGFEVIGGQLRYYLYYWLERETHILRKLGDYDYKQNELGESIFNRVDREEIDEDFELHEQVIENQKTFQARIERLNRRKEWLRSNELLLRTFISYCSLHNAKGGGLTSIKMELSLLMQELIKDRSMKQLYQSVPIPTTIPLLSASVASSKNVIAGPIQMIQSIVTEILTSVACVQNQAIPTLFNNSIIYLTVKDLSLSLSSCVYQCLCDSDAFTEPTNQVVTGMQGFSRNVFYKTVNDRPVVRSAKKLEVVSSPRNWPGVSSLTKLLDREQDIEAPKLKILLFKTLLSVYNSIFLNAFVFYDCSILVRLMSKEWNSKMWNSLFGGGGLTEYKYKTSSTAVNMNSSSDVQRARMNARLGLTSQASTSPVNTSPLANMVARDGYSSEEKTFVKESFVPPEISMINFLLSSGKKQSRNRVDDVENDEESEEEEDDECSVDSDDGKGDVGDGGEGFDDDDDDLRTNSEHLNPKSFSWTLMRYGLVRLSFRNIIDIMEVIGVEMNELAILSPMAYEVVRSLERWSELLKNELNLFDGPPENYLIDHNATHSLNGTNKSGLSQFLIDPNNTPFDSEDKSTKGVRKLWLCLVKKKILQEDFIHYIFTTRSHNQSNSDMNNTLRAADDNNTSYSHQDTSLNNLGAANGNYAPPVVNKYKILHKDHEAIHSFCVNQKDQHIMSFCTTREIIEIDFKNQLEDSGEERGRHDHYYHQQYSMQNESFVESGGFYDPNSIGLLSRNRSHILSRRPIKDVKKLASHPTLPYYLSGTNEGIVKLWHWGSSEALSSYKQVEKSYSAKITKLLFNVHGNKFGVSDMDGYLHLYQLLGCSFKSYLTLRCHKVINDFLFIDSSSLLLTIGTSNDSYVISLWDTLMPSNKSLIKTYREADISSGTCAAYSPLNHFAYCGNRKGEVNIYDVRIHKKLQKFVASESSVKALDLDAEEYYIATGSSEGNVKIWDIKTLEPIQTYHNEHSKSSLIRSVNSGVNQLYFTSDNHLMSCGSEGTLILRDLKNLHL